MMTIAEVAETKTGSATALMDLTNGVPLKSVACPFAKPDKLPDRVRQKDWTTYQGVLHTDHSVRDEFLQPEAKPPLRARPFLMDFTYIYDRTQQDYVRFMRGQLVSEEEVFHEIGPPGEWRTLGGFKRTPSVVRSRTAASEIRSLIAKTSRWPIGKRALDQLLR